MENSTINEKSLIMILAKHVEAGQKISDDQWKQIMESLYLRFRAIRERECDMLLPHYLPNPPTKSGPKRIMALPRIPWSPLAERADGHYYEAQVAWKFPSGRAELVTKWAAAIAKDGDWW